LTGIANFTVTNGFAWAFSTPVATDLGGPASLQVMATTTNLTDGNGYIATRTWRGTDLCGNTSTYRQTVTVQNSLPAILNIVATDPNASEAGPDPGMFVITRSGYLNSQLVIQLGISGVARNGVDYVGLPTQVNLPAGATSVAILLTPIADSLNEKTESATLSLLPAAGCVVGQNVAATVLIANASPPTKRK